MFCASFSLCQLLVGPFWGNMSNVRHGTQNPWSQWGVAFHSTWPFQTSWLVALAFPIPNRERHGYFCLHFYAHTWWSFCYHLFVSAHSWICLFFFSSRPSKDIKHER